MCLDMLKNDILMKFNTRPNKPHPYLVGIDGLAGAGKTTLVKKLEERLKQKCPVIVLHLDDYIVEREKRYGTGHEEWYEYYYLQWDIEMLSERLFKKLQMHDGKLILPYYDKFADRINQKAISFSSDGIILIEGIFILRKEWKAFFDYTVFVDCPKEIRYQRVLERDKYIGDEQAVLEKYKRRYWPAEKYYLETEYPKRSADKIFPCV